MYQYQRSALPGTGWRKSSYSNSSGDCIEAGQGAGAILMRDSRDRHGPVLAVPAAAWRSFTEAVKAS